MNRLFLVALQCCMAVLVHSAPVRLLADPEFKRTTELMKTLVLKIRVDMVPVYSAIVIEEGLKLDLSSLPAHLDDMRMSLGIRDAPILKPLSEHFTLERCLSRMSTGVRLYHDLLGALATKLSGLTYLMNDLQDLLGQIRNMQALAQLSDIEEYQSPDLASRLADSGNYELQVASHQTFARLRIFCHDLVRSLRNISSYKA